MNHFSKINLKFFILFFFISIVGGSILINYTVISESFGLIFPFLFGAVTLSISLITKFKINIRLKTGEKAIFKRQTFRSVIDNIFLKYLQIHQIRYVMKDIDFYLKGETFVLCVQIDSVEGTPKSLHENSNHLAEQIKDKLENEFLIPKVQVLFDIKNHHKNALFRIEKNFE